MINLSEETIFVVFPDGTSAPFDVLELQERLGALCQNAEIEPETWVPQDIALSVEFALLRKFRGVKSASIKAEEIDEIVHRILEDIGCVELARIYRKDSNSNRHHSANLQLNGLRKFLEESMNLSGDLLATVSSKVQNTLISMGAQQPSTQLVMELANYFREYALETVHLDVQMPDFEVASGALRIDRKLILARIDQTTRDFSEKRILKIHHINLKIFPAMRLDVRLTGLVTEAKLVAPLTELAVEPLFVRLARSIDSLCMIGDGLCREQNFDSVTPLKLILTFSDVSIFAREWMDCSQPDCLERLSRDLAVMLSGYLARTPFKVICH